MGDDVGVLTVRPLTADDATGLATLAYEAFGVPGTRRPSRPRIDQPGRTYFGAFDGDMLVGRLTDRAYDSWFGGVLVPTSGIAAVTVAAELRGQGVLTPMFDRDAAVRARSGARDLDDCSPPRRGSTGSSATR